MHDDRSDFTQVTSTHRTCKDRTWRPLCKVTPVILHVVVPPDASESTALFWCALSLSLARSLASLFSVRAVTGKSERGRGTTSR